MARRKKTLPGLNRDSKTGIWKLDKIINEHGRIYRSTRTQSYDEAEKRALRWIKEIEDAVIHGKITRITFNEAAAKYINTETKKSLQYDINDLNKVMPHIGHYYIDQVYQETIDPYIKAEQKKGRKSTTINRTIRVVSRILNLCARSWRDDFHMPYLKTAPLLEQLKETDKQITQPIEYDEEQKLLAQLNDNYKDFWTFAVNTGLRQQNQAGLQWKWKVEMPSLNTFGFLIPENEMKNAKDFLLVLNSTALSIIEKWQGKDSIYVFPSPEGGKYWKFNAKHFNKARIVAGLKGTIKWHSARTTFATRLRAAGISEEDRAQLMSHSSKSITTQYSWADIGHLIQCVEKLGNKQEITDDKKDLSSLFRIGK